MELVKDVVQPPREAEMAYARLPHVKRSSRCSGAAAHHAIAVMPRVPRLLVQRARGATKSASARASALALSALLGRSASPFQHTDAQAIAVGSSRQ
jgi:hypothetical protein